MTQTHWPLGEGLLDHWSWPSNDTVALMVDGCDRPDLAPSLYQWSGDHGVEAACLYQGTLWEALSDVSPWLVFPSGPDDPVLNRILTEDTVGEWGYLVSSGLSRSKLVRWFQGLLQIERQPGHPELLKIAHPALARRVIGNHLMAQPGQQAVRQLITPDHTSECWVHQRAGADTPDGMAAKASLPVLLYNDALQAEFDAFDARQDSLALWAQLDDKERDWLGGVSLPQGYTRLNQLVHEAASHGHRSLREYHQYLRRRRDITHHDH